MNYTPGFTLQDLDKLIAQMQSVRSASPPQTVYVGEFGQLGFEIQFLSPQPKHSISSWYLPKRVKKILAEGRIGRKESGFRLLVYRSAWVSNTGIVQFIGPENELVKYTGKRFRYELYNSTKLVLQTNSLKDALNYTIEKP